MAVSERPILIVGAGPVGLAAAIELTRRGYKVRIVDRDAVPAPLSKAIGINPRTLELLEPSGASARLVAAGHKIAHIELRTAGRQLGRIDFTRLRHRYNFMLALPQNETERHLEAALEGLGVMVERRTDFSGIEQDANEARCTIVQDGRAESVAAEYVIGADGAHSTVRKELAIPFSGAPYDDEWTLADVRMAWPFADSGLQLFICDEGLLLTIPLGRGRFRIVASQPEAKALLPAGAAIQETMWHSTFRISNRQADTYRKGRVFLAGDAAHVHSPLGARGMNLGIEDAMVLAARLDGGGLARYAAERRRAGAAVIRMTDFQTRMFTATDPLTRLMRRATIAAVSHVELLQRPLRRRILGLAG